MTEPRSEVDRLLALIEQRYGDRLTAEQLDGVRQHVERIARDAAALRRVVLTSSDEPFPPFAPFRADS